MIVEISMLVVQFVLYNLRRRLYNTKTTIRQQYPEVPAPVNQSKTMAINGKFQSDIFSRLAKPADFKGMENTKNRKRLPKSEWSLECENAREVRTDLVDYIGKKAVNIVGIVSSGFGRVVETGKGKENGSWGWWKTKNT